MDEIALIDLPAMINTALRVTGAKKMGSVGHSQVEHASSAYCGWWAAHQQSNRTGFHLGCTMPNHLR